MSKGTVKWFNKTKGYGFVGLDDKSGDVFWHISEMQKSGISNLSEGQKIKFDVKDNRGKSVAINIALV